MVGLVLVACIALLVHRHFSSGNEEAPLTPVEPYSALPLTPIDPAELQADWQRSVNEILTDYDRTGDARVAKERMLSVRVPGSGRDAHLALYVAFNTLAESRPEGKAKLAAARATFQTMTATLPGSASSTIR